MIHNIIFDMGNVLLDYNPDRPLQEFFDTEEERQLIKRELFEGPEWIAGDYGYITNLERYEFVKLRVPERLHKQLYTCVTHWPDFMDEIPNAKAFVKKMKERGFGIYILSNACSAFYEYFPRFLPLAYFDGVVVSSDINKIKPAKEIYEYLLQTHGLTASECFFVDDRVENVEGAVKAGMRGVVFRGDFQELEQEIEKESV